MKENKVYLSHILDCIHSILSYTEGLDEDSFNKNFMVQDAVWNTIQKDIPSLLNDLKEIHSKL